MLDSILGASGSITITELAICMLTSLVLGVVIALVYMFRTTYTKNFVITLALLPVVVQTVIIVVNGNLGTGVAVMGAFSLIRFRSAPGSAREIVGVFFAMAAGLAVGTGYVVYAILFTIFTSIVLLLLTVTRFGEQKNDRKTLKIVIPEDLDYVHLFDDLFARYTHSANLGKVRTTNLGGLYELQYTIALKEPNMEKELLDQMRQRNGNLSVVCGQLVAASHEL